MAGNEQLISSLVADSAPKEIQDLKKEVALLRAEFLETAKAAAVLNEATGRTTGIRQQNDAMAKSQIAAEKLIQVRNRTIISNNQVAASEARHAALLEKSAASAQKALSPYQQLSKELDNLRAKAKDVGAQFGLHSQQFKDASKPVQELDARLKGIDQTLGQSQRNVGNYSSAISGLISQYIPFGDSTIKIKENLGKLTESLGESEGATGALAEAFGGFTIGVFAVAVGSAIYYLKEFRSTAEQLKVVTAGIKNSFGTLGEGIVEFIKSGNPDALGKALDNLPQAYKQGAKSQEFLNRKENASELTELTDAELSAEAERLRALAELHKKDINERLRYQTEAEKIENQILQNQKADANNSLAAVVGVLNAHHKLNQSTLDLIQGTGEFKGISLQDQAAKVQALSLKGQEFPSDAFDLYKEYYEKRIGYEKGASNEIIRIQNDRENIELRDAREKIKAQEELDAAKLEGEQFKEKLILDDEDKNYETKLDALANFVKASKKLADIKLADELAAAKVPGRAGLDPEIVALKEKTAKQKYNNEIAKIDSEALTQRQNLDTKETDRQKKNLQELLAVNKNYEADIISQLQETSNARLQIIEDERNKEASILDAKFAKGKLTQQEYRNQLLRIDDQYNVDRLGQIAFFEQSVLETKQAALNNDIEVAKNRGATPDQINEIIKKSGVPEQKNVVAKAGKALDDALGKQSNDEAQAKLYKINETKKDVVQAIQDVQQLQDDASKILQANYEAEIALLEKKKVLIEEQAQSEIDGINNSILSAADKQRRINIISAQGAQQQKVIDQEIQKRKEKQAVYDRALAIANIIENTAIGATKSAATIFGLPLVPVILALGAAELATVLASPLPKFATGTSYSPEGLAVVGEKGAEYRINPDGSTGFTPSTPSLTYLEKGTKIFTHEETVRKFVKPEKLNYAGGEAVDFRRMEQLYQENNRLLKQIAGKSSKTVVNGWLRENMAAQSWGQYESKFRR